MSEDAARLTGHLTRVLYELTFDSPHAYRVGHETYELAQDDQYAELGEDVCAEDVPLILVRRSDGKFFEAEISVTVWETSAEARQADRDRITKAREQGARAKGRAT